MSNYAGGGYLDQKTRSPLSLGAAIAINGAGVAALLLVNPVVVSEQFKIFKTIDVKSDPPPPEPMKPEPPKPRQERQAVRDTITLTKPPLDDLKIGFRTPILPIPTFPTGGGTSMTGGTEIAPIPPHVPVFKGSQVDNRYAAALQPPYPPGKIRSEEEGVVIVRVRIGADGRVKEIQKVGNADEAFYRATAEQAMKRWRFVPATSDGTPVEEWKTMTVRFRLDT